MPVALLAHCIRGPASSNGVQHEVTRHGAYFDHAFEELCTQCVRRPLVRLKFAVPNGGDYRPAARGLKSRGQARSGRRKSAKRRSEALRCLPWSPGRAFVATGDAGAGVGMKRGGQSLLRQGRAVADRGFGQGSEDPGGVGSGSEDAGPLRCRRGQRFRRPWEIVGERPQ